jgi:bifunctional non-homologous end joining protein LigD
VPGHVTFQAFDLLWFDGRSLLDQPLWRRKNLLHDIVMPAPEFAAVDFVDDEGIAFFDAVVERKLAGVVAKQKKGRYLAGRRSRDWLEIRALHGGDFVVGGYTFGGGRRKGEPFSQLLLGSYAGGRLKYVGSVSGGLADAEARRLIALIEPLLTDAPPFDDPPDIPRFIHWTRPALVCHVRFSEWSKDGLLRFPIFSTLRPDLAASDCELEAAGLY